MRALPLTSCAVRGLGMVEATTVVVALAVGVSSGTIGTWWSLKHDRVERMKQRMHERREWFRERQIDTADDFLSSVTLLVSTAEEVQAYWGEPRDDDDRLYRGELASEVNKRVTAHHREALMHAQRISLVFSLSVYEAALEVLRETAAAQATLVYYYSPPGRHTDTVDAEVEAEIDAMREKIIQTAALFQAAVIDATRN